MPIPSALLGHSRSCVHDFILSVYKALAGLQNQCPRHHPQFLRGIGVVPTMPDVEDPGNPPRKSKEHHPPGHHAKQVHFETTNGGGKQPYPPPPQASSAPNSPGATQAASPRRSQQQTPSKSAPVDNQPTSFPQVGAPPGQFGPGQWYTSADPRMSLNQPQQYYQQQQPQYHLPPNGGGGYWQQPGVPVFANDLHHRLPYHHRHHNTSALVADTTAAAARDNKNMAYYQNAGPPSTGVNFQPPVPDTTFGPIPHVYVPRFDAAPVPQVGPPSLQLLYAPADPCPPSFTVFMPKTFYNEGFNYYASVLSRAVCRVADDDTNASTQLFGLPSESPT
ncbi:hypothetical protein BM221_000990 [Beauveria bassiana]|uniref:Uncharacterized protein n=1 Tax=Beauveria bassiana TaxID=176275 RepID=A0A2N6P224_BEABA|nr:hypothetical protein BM221_000990 [Beauveria bassiana]